MIDNFEVYSGKSSLNSVTEAPTTDPIIKPKPTIKEIMSIIANPLLNPFDFRIFKRGDTRIDIKIASKKGTKIDAASFKPDTMIVKEAATTKNLDKLDCWDDIEFILIKYLLSISPKNNNKKLKEYILFLYRTKTDQAFSL